MNKDLCIAVQAISEEPKLWDKYWKDFISTKFHISSLDDKLALELVNLTFTRQLTRLTPQRRLVALHCKAHINQVNLAKLMSTLRPLQDLQKVNEATLHPGAQLPLAMSPGDTLRSIVEMKSEYISDSTALYQFILDSLFLSFANGCLRYGSSLQYLDTEQLVTWHKSYRNVVCLLCVMV